MAEQILRLKSFQQGVASAGTAEPISGTAAARDIVAISAPGDNTGDIAIGDSDVTMANGFILAPGTVINVQDLKYADGNGTTINLNEVYVDADNNDDAVSVLVLTRDDS